MAFDGRTVINDHGPIRVDLPRDRDSSSAPILISKHQRRFTGFDKRLSKFRFECGGFSGQLCLFFLPSRFLGCQRLGFVVIQFFARAKPALSARRSR